MAAILNFFTVIQLLSHGGHFEFCSPKLNFSVMYVVGDVGRSILHDPGQEQLLPDRHGSYLRILFARSLHGRTQHSLPGLAFSKLKSWEYTKLLRKSTNGPYRFER